MLEQSTYTYDPLDRRIGVDETVSGSETKTSTVYDGVNAYADFGGSGTLLVRYLYGPGANQVLARTSASGTTAWYLADHEGTVRDVVGASGTVIDHVAYDAYGNTTGESGASNGDRFKFDGMAWDAAIGDYYDNARYYDSAIGRFLSVDPTGFRAGDADLYRFVGNNATNATDPTGLWSVWKWVYTGDGNASDDVYNGAVQAGGDYLYNNSPIRGGYVYVGGQVEEHGGKNVEGIGVGSWDIDHGATGSIIAAPGGEIGPVGINGGLEVTHSFETGENEVSTIGLVNVDLGKIDVGVWGNPVEGDVGVYIGGDAGPVFGGGGITVRPGLLGNFLKWDFWAGRL